MALGITAFSEAAYASDGNNANAYPSGIALALSLGSNTTEGDNNVDLTGIQATITNAGAVAGSSVQFSVSGMQMTSSIGEEGVDIGVPVSGQELTITNKKLSQDTLTAFAQTPFATQSPNTTEVPIVDVATTTGGDIGNFALSLSLGTFSVQADGNVSVVVTEHTLNTAIGSPSIAGIGNVPVTGIIGQTTIGSAAGVADHAVDVTGSQMTMSMGEETPAGNADVTPTGIQLTGSIGSVSQSTSYDVSGIQMSASIGSVAIVGTAVVIPTGIQLQSNTGSPNITAWAEIDPGVSNVWTEVDRAA
jgi:hypothetical protein